jgi:hypothetical protein
MDERAALAGPPIEGEVFDERCHVVLTADQAEALYQWMESDECPAYWESPLAPVQQQVSAWRRVLG